MLRKKSRLLSLLLVLAILFSSVTVLADDDVRDVVRISGADRYKTSIEVSRKAFDESDYAVIASGQTFPDALVGGVLAGELDAPLLVTSRNAVSNELLAELNRLEVKKVYLLGGLNTLTEEVEKALSEFEVERLAGDDRFKTAEVISQVVESYILKDDDDDDDNDDIKTYHADGRNFPDALAAAPYIVEEDGVLLLNAGSPVTDGIAIGGVNSVPGDVKRIAGSDRYDTAVKIAEAYDDFDKIVLVDGTNYPDALSASGYAAEKDAVILLTSPKTLVPVPKAFIDNTDKDIVIIGGENSVSKDIENLLKGINEEPTPEPEPEPTPEEPQPTPEPEPTPNPTPTLGPSEKAYLYAKGRIIGNKQSLIYHSPGQRFYEDVNYENAVFFDTPADAEAAGYRASKV